MTRMTPREFIKKFGWDITLTLWDDCENDVISYRGFRVGCFFLGDLLRSYSIVCAFGWIDLAKEKAHKIGSPHNSVVFKAIADVESCQ